MITEFGFEGNRNGPVEERGTYQYQAAAAAFHLGVFASKPYIPAAMWFALQTSPPGPGWSGGDPFPDPPFVQKGEIDLLRQPGPAAVLHNPVDLQSTPQIGPGAASAARARPALDGPQANRQRSSVAITRKPSPAVSFLPSSVARAR